jgi:hypothetical protein
MEPADARKPKIAVQPMKVRKPSLAPGVKRVSLAAAKDVLLQDAGAGNPKVQHMLDCVDEPQGEKGT